MMPVNTYNNVQYPTNKPNPSGACDHHITAAPHTLNTLPTYWGCATTEKGNPSTHGTVCPSLNP